MQIFSETNFDFLRWRWHAFALSALIILAGIAVMYTRGGLPLGVDFSGGTIVVLKFEQPVSEETIRTALDATIAGEKVVQSYGQPSENQIMIRLPQIASEQGTELERGSVDVLQAIEKANLGKSEVLSTEIVGPVVGADLQRKGIYATLASMVGILLYIAVRFRFSFGVGAVVAVFHDLLVTLAFLVFFGYELSLNIVAALLTMTGYSVNDTIVIFDRVRENLRSARRDRLDVVVNRSVNQTLGRTVITAGATFLAVLSLYLFGGEVLRGFAFTMLVGIITGTYSTVFIAAAVAIVLSKGRVSSAGTAAQADAAKAAKPSSTGAQPRPATAAVSRPAEQQVRTKKRRRA